MRAIKIFLSRQVGDVLSEGVTSFKIVLIGCVSRHKRPSGVKIFVITIMSCYNNNILTIHIFIYDVKKGIE